MVLTALELAPQLLETYGSPLYVYDRDRLEQTIQKITQSISYPETQFRFATVTNGNMALLKIFQDADWGIHANTPGDIYLGLQAGFHPSQIVYSGSNLNRDEMSQILDWGISTLNLDSLSQLQLCCDVYLSLETKKSAPKLGLRLNDPELTGDSRIGVRSLEFPEAIAIVKVANLKLSGLHFYRGTGTNATDSFTNATDRVLKLAQKLPDWEYLDFGGGFGYPYDRDGIAFDWQTFGNLLTARLQIQNLSRSPDSPINLVIEPGRSAVAGCAMLLATVVSVKWQERKQIVGVDTTVANISVPSVHGGYRKVVACTSFLNWQMDSETFTTDVCGNTTYSRDYLGKNCLLPKLAIGDNLAILDVGAYGYAMSSHFLHRPRPAEVLLEKGGSRIIRQRERYEVLVANQQVS